MIKATKCAHCKSLFNPLRAGHIHCSETCRKLRHKAGKNRDVNNRKKRRLSEKLKKLALSPFGLYLVREIKRAGTVQILSGHTADSLKALVSLRRRCTTFSGYEEGAPLRTYELSHIWPVSASESLGLLCVENLVIAPRSFNRTHGQKSPIDARIGRSMPKELLLSKWNVSENLESLQTLKLARSFLGEIFDAWLSGFLITHTQKQLLIKILEKQGLPIKRLRNLTLQHLRAIADEEDLPHFDISIPAGDRRSILAVELVRLGANSLLVELLEKIAEEDNCLGNPVWEFVGTPSIRPEFEEFVIQQALQCLHGQNYSVDWKDQPLTAYFKDIPSNKPTENVIIGRSDNEEFLL